MYKDDLWLYSYNSIYTYIHSYVYCNCSYRMRMYHNNVYVIYVIALCYVESHTLRIFITVRLVNGTTEYEGRVEVYYYGEWGTVCDDGWDLKDAQVVCRQLGLGPPIAALGLAHYGEGNGAIFLDEVDCVGNELRIQNCSHNGWGNGICGRNEAAGVECGNGI